MLQLLRRHLLLRLTGSAWRHLLLFSAAPALQLLRRHLLLRSAWPALVLVLRLHSVLLLRLASHQRQVLVPHQRSARLLLHLVSRLRLGLARLRSAV